MKMLKSIYQDGMGNLWEFERCSIPKNKGTYNYWIAECKGQNKCIKGDLKRDLIKTIKDGIKVQK
jgi:hypothetical protein